MPQTKHIEYGAERTAAGAGIPGGAAGSGGGGADGTGGGSGGHGTAGTDGPTSIGGDGGVSGGGAGTAPGDGSPGPGDGAGASEESDGASGASPSTGSGETTGVSVDAGASLSRRSRRKNDAIDLSASRCLLALPPRPPHPFSVRRLPTGMSSAPSVRLRELGLELPPPPTPKGSYVPVVVHGGFAFVAGQIVTDASGVVQPGRVDREVSSEDARALARRAALQAVSALAGALGSIDRVRRIVRVGVFVASSDGFARQHEVANGATDLLAEIWGEHGRPARAAVGVASLPLNAPVEIELIAAVE